MSSKKLFVAGATGQQGGSVVRALLEKGHEVYGLTRNSNSERAQTLTNQGVKIVQGNLDQPDALKEYFESVDAIFLVGSSFEGGVEAETAQGIRIIEAAKAAETPHLVYSSVAAANENTGIPHFDSKYKIEQRLVNSGLSHTIIAPAYFYDNMLAPFVLPGLQQGVFSQAMPADLPLQSVSVKNIGELAAEALESPENFAGKRINLSGDELTGEQYAKAISAASGRDIKYVEAPIEQVRQFSEEMALMYEWFVSKGYSTDIEKLKSDYPQVKWESFAQWAGRQDWSILAN